MRYVNGAMDIDAWTNSRDKEELNGKYDYYINNCSVPEQKALLIKVVNAGFPHSEEEKKKLFYFLTDEDFANEHFAMVYLVKRILDLGSSVNAFQS